jgi:hypothetical protein
MVSTNGALAFGGTEFGSTKSIRTNNLLVNHKDRKRAVRTNFGNKPGPKSTCRCERLLNPRPVDLLSFRLLSIRL